MGYIEKYVALRSMRGLIRCFCKLIKGYWRVKRDIWRANRELRSPKRVPNGWHLDKGEIRVVQGVNRQEGTLCHGSISSTGNGMSWCFGKNILQSNNPVKVKQPAELSFNTVLLGIPLQFTVSVTSTGVLEKQYSLLDLFGVRVSPI